MDALPQGLLDALPANSAAFLLASLFLELTPGPNMTWLALLSAAHGRRAGFQAVGGVGLGLAIIGMAAAFGMAAIIAETPWIYEGLRWGGILFLLYLAWDGWRGEAGEGGQPDDLRHFWRGLTANILNPKAAVFYIAVLPTFAGPDAGLADTLILTGFYVAIATAVHGGIVLLAGLAQPILQDPVREKWSRRILSALLALVALWFAWST